MEIRKERFQITLSERHLDMLEDISKKYKVTKKEAFRMSVEYFHRSFTKEENN